MQRPVWLFAGLLSVFVAAPSPGTASEDDAQRAGLAALLGSDDEGFPKALEPHAFEFPRDHGPHPGFRNEWWYLTGNLDSEDGRRFGFELTIFRFALTPWQPPSISAWRTNQVYIAHFAVTDVAGERFFVAERFARGALGLAGATAEPFRAWIGDWQVAARAPAVGGFERWRLHASDEAFALELELDATKTPVLHGDEGRSQKSSDPGNASYYYSITRWESRGTLRIDDRSWRVTGASWLDREWSSSALAADQAGWDWFALQLSDGSELMFYNLRRLDGAQDEYSAGTWIGADGQVLALARDEVTIEVQDRWLSPAGGSYPSRWEIKVPQQGLRLVVRPVIADQELFTTVRYWEGAVDARGERGGAPVTGRGYVELTGYAD